MTAKQKETSRRRKMHFLRRLTDTTVAFDLRVTMIIALAGAVGNTLGFAANFALYGMNTPTAICAACALLMIANLLFGLSGRLYRVFGWAMLVLLDLFEFPLLVFTYGSVMYPYLMIGFLGVLMLARGRGKVLLNVGLGLYDVAVIVLSSLHPYIFGPQDTVGLMGSAVATYAIAIGALTCLVIAWQSVSVIETSDIDSISGALTRTGFLRGAEEYLCGESARNYAVLYFDIKNFKIINSVCGIGGGNGFLREVAGQLASCELHPKLISRLDADHFVCIVAKENLKYDKLNELCHLAYTNNGKSIPLVMHCGVFCVENGEESVQTICDKAAVASRYIRGGQSRHYYVFDADAVKAYAQETKLLGELGTAIREKEFEPYYQPIVDCKTKKIVSAEALVRWIHPEKGVLSPGLFIPILEKKELISDLDALMAEKVSAFIGRQVDSEGPIVPISVNLSRIDLFDNRLMERLRVLATENASAKGKYRIELTESAYESLTEDTMRTLSQFRQCGIQMLMDDFGIGYSSLGMITEYEFDFIKFDKEFADRMADSEKMRSMIRILIEMAHKMGAKVVMEGIETQSQYDEIADAGCDYVQGYLFYRPMPEKEFLELLQKQEQDNS